MNRLVLFIPPYRGSSYSIGVVLKELEGISEKVLRIKDITGREYTVYEKNTRFHSWVKGGKNANP